MPGLPLADASRYQVLGELARGGLGRVLEVEDLRLRRTVALKQTLRDSEHAYARFSREAFLTARLEHPAIVPVHDVGRFPSGEPFYSMKLVAGRSLHEVVATARSLDERLALLPNVIAVADAIAYAHSEGVIHRDLKPANVLVGDFGETVVIDWGLAKELGDGDEDELDELTFAPVDDSLTVAGAVLGTPRYMPPEQARGASVGPRADVYAIGAILYEVLTGAPPYGEVERERVLAAVLAGPPAPVESVQSGIPPELGAIVRKAMAHDPSARYPSARELSEDLRRFQTGRLVGAHYYSRWSLLLRWLRRYRAPVGVAAVALLLMTVLGFVSVRRVLAERDVAERRANQLLLSQARGALERDATEALAWLRTYPTTGEDWRVVRSLAMEAQSRGVARHSVLRDGFFDFTADGRGWLSVRADGSLVIHDLATGAQRAESVAVEQVSKAFAAADGHTFATVKVGDVAVTLHDIATDTAMGLPAHGEPIDSAALSPDRRWIASSSADGRVQLWPLGPGEGRFLDAPKGRGSVFFSNNGRWLVKYSWESGLAKVWAIESLEPRTLEVPKAPSDFDLSPDGSLLVLLERSGEVSVWSTATGACVRRLEASHSKANNISFSLDGRFFASAGDDGLVHAWSLSTWQEHTWTGHTSAVRAVRFSPDNRWLASGSTDGEVRLWEVEGDREYVVGRSPRRVDLIHFSPDGRYLVSQGDNHEARIWDMPQDGSRVLRDHPIEILQVAFSPEGQRLATASIDATVRLWDLRTGQSQALEGHTDIVCRIAFSPNGEKIASVSFDGTARIWDLTACRSPAACSPPGRILAGHDGIVRGVDFSPNGRTIATAGEDGTVRLWDVSTGEARVMRGHTSSVRVVAFSPDGTQLASAGMDRELWIWELSTGKGQPLGAHDGWVHALAYSNDGRWLFTAGADQTIRRWAPSTRKADILVDRTGRRPCFALSPDGRTLAFSSQDGNVGMVDLQTGERRSLGLHPGPVNRLVFSPDSTQLASAGLDRTVRLWDVDRGTMSAVLRHDGELFDIAFSPDGQWLAGAGASKVARLFRLAGRPTVPDDAAALQAWMASLSSVALDAQERPVNP